MLLPLTACFLPVQPKDFFFLFLLIFLVQSEDLFSNEKGLAFFIKESKYIICFTLMCEKVGRREKASHEND